MRQVDPHASVVAYLDDTYLVGNSAAVVRGLSAFAEHMATLGLRVHPRKTQVWAPKVPADTWPTELVPYRVAELVAVGTPVPYARASLAASAIRPGSASLMMSAPMFLWMLPWMPLSLLPFCSAMKPI